MKNRIGFLSIVFLFVNLSAAYSQSLADLAKKEQERRANIKAGEKTITNEEAAKYHSGTVTTSELPEAPSGKKPESDKTAADAADAAKDAKDKANPDEPVDLQGRPESYWRQTMADARKQVETLKNGSDVIILKLNDLQNKFYAEASGFKQQEIQAEIKKTFKDQEENKQQLEKARSALQELENEARKSGALPGWLTPKAPAAEPSEK